MTLSLHDATVASFVQGLGGVEGFLQRGMDHARDANIDPEEIVATRLFPDMLPFRFQIHSVVNHSWGAIEGVRRGEYTPPGGADLDYAGLQAAVSAAKTKLEALTHAEVDGFVGKDVAFRLGERVMPFTAEMFLLSFSVPNFYFHAATAYDILRVKGAPLGKRDFLGRPRMKM
jgi:uncharacterized protein